MRDGTWVLCQATQTFPGLGLVDIPPRPHPPRCKVSSMRHLDLSISIDEMNRQIGPCVTLIIPLLLPAPSTIPGVQSAQHSLNDKQ